MLAQIILLCPLSAIMANTLPAVNKQSKDIHQIFAECRDITHKLAESRTVTIQNRPLALAYQIVYTHIAQTHKESPGHFIYNTNYESYGNPQELRLDLPQGHLYGPSAQQLWINSGRKHLFLDTIQQYPDLIHQLTTGWQREQPAEQQDLEDQLRDIPAWSLLTKKVILEGEDQLFRHLSASLGFPLDITCHVDGNTNRIHLWIKKEAITRVLQRLQLRLELPQDLIK
jgi:hypothetical protein